MTKTAVVLCNLGGPDSLKAVKPFLFNLFNDKAIINLPQPLRFLLAKIISTLRASKAQEIYRHMGGKSPLLEHTQAQAEALEKKLEKNQNEYKIFVTMRHWHPMSRVVVKKVKAYAPDHIIVLPLYPQYSDSTTGSSFAHWDRECKKQKLDIPTSRICCFPIERNFIAAHAKLIKDMYWKASEHGTPRILFSAHGLPEKMIEKGDPYQWQIEKTVDAIVQILAIDQLDHSICYQSRVGPMKWIGPSTPEEILRAAQDKVPMVIVPVAFVSEHSETLVELDVEYRKLAEDKNAVGYYRVPALGVDAFFIDALSELCLTCDPNQKIASFNQMRFCSRNFGQCPCE